MDPAGGDDERILFGYGDEMESEAWNLGVGWAIINQNKYRSGQNVAVWYKTASDFSGLSSASYNLYDGVRFESLGWVIIRLTNE